MTVEHVLESGAYHQARSILGEDFISPEEVMGGRMDSYTDSKLNELRQSLPDPMLLTQLRDNGMILVPGPSIEMSLLAIRNLQPNYFRRAPGGREVWYEEPEAEIFACHEHIEAFGWLALHKKPLDGSLNKTWSELQVLVKDSMTIPNIADVTWALMVYHAVRGVRLMSDSCVHTCSVGTDKQRVNIGMFGPGGLSVWYSYDNQRRDDIGLALSRRF